MTPTFSCVLVFLLLLRHTSSRVSTKSGIEWCIVSSASHILYNETCTEWSSSTNNITIEAMKGEYENIQLIINPSPIPTNISISAFDLVPIPSITPDDPSILPHTLFTFYQVAHVNCSETTRYEGSGGSWRPDPLFPLNPDTYGDTLALSSTNSQVIHISIGPIPENAAPGMYTGKILVHFTNSALPEIQIPVQLQVLNITIPSTLESSFQTIFSFSDGALSPFYDSTKYNFTAMKYQYFNILTDYRIPPDELYQSTPRAVDDYIYLSSTTQWANLEDIQATANIIATSMNLSNSSSKCGPWPQVVIDKVMDQLNISISELQSRHISIDNLYVYGFDELPTSCKPGIQQLFGGVQKKWPEIKSAATLNWKDGDMMMDLPLNAWNLQYQEIDIDAVEKWVSSKDDRAMWLYHCIEPSGIEYLNTFIERPLMESRILFWLAASYPSVSGWLYYAVNLWRGCPEKGIPNKRIIRRLNMSVALTDFDPANYIWCPRTDIFANGDGYFLYPGEYGPIPTSRLMNIRDGLEDLELFRMIKDKDKMVDLIHEVVRGATNFTLDIALMESIRKRAIDVVLAQ